MAHPLSARILRRPAPAHLDCARGVLEPNFVVLDEPTSALDMLFQAQMVDLLRELQRKRDLTYMFISHDLRVVASLASHLIVMRHGKVVEEGPAAELFKNPRAITRARCSPPRSASRPRPRGGAT
jgi:ABC-type microcin C transport system duplicated ATPase subunit YejF